MEILLEAVLAAFDRLTLERALLIDLGRNLEDVASPNLGNRDLFLQVIVTANRDRWIEPLINSLKERNVGNQALQEAIGEILTSQQLGAIPATNIDPHLACLIGRHVMIDRDDLRSHMRNFTAGRDFDPRLLIITGPDASGKTYTQEFVVYLARYFSLPPPIYVDLSAWPGGACSPDDLIDSIGRQMGLPFRDLPVDDEAQGARRAIKLKDWLTGEVRNLNARGELADDQWIVLDDLDHPGVPSETVDLVDLLMLAVSRNVIPRLRLVLLGYPRPAPPDVIRDILVEELAPIDDTAVRRHARELVAQYPVDAQRVGQESDQIAGEALQNLAAPFDRAKLTMLTRQFENAVATFLERI